MIWPMEEKEHLGKLEERYSELLQRDPQLESRPTFLFFKGAANGLFAEGAERLLRGVNDQQALMIGIKCERGSHRFFKKYGERFEDSEGKQIFLEFADEERNHLDLLIRELHALSKRQGACAASHGRRTRARGTILIDLHLHTTASDGRLTPTELVDLAAASGVRVIAVTDHDTTDGIDEARPRRARAWHRRRSRHRDHVPSRTAVTCTCSATSSTPSMRTSSSLSNTRV